MIQNIPLWDFHCHFPVKGEMAPGYVFKKADMAAEPKRKRSLGPLDPGSIWSKAFNFPKMEEPSASDDENSDWWYDEVERKGVDKAVFVTGGGNDRLAAIVKRHPDRFYGFAHHHPEEKGAAEELERAVKELGMAGYKILAPLVEAPLSDRRFYPIWEACRALDIPVLFHFGLMGAAGGVPTAENISPLSVAGAALDFPDVNFVVPHFGCTHIADALHLCWTRPNVWIDTSGSNQWARWMPYPLTMEDLYRKFNETIGAGRILFGTDSSWIPRGFARIYLEEQHKAMRFIGMKEEEINLVLWKNCAYLLKEET